MAKAGAGGVARSALSQLWVKKLTECLDFDSWGQREEAKEGYTKLAKMMVEELASQASEAWTNKEAEAVQNLAICLRLRSYEIHKGDADGITIDNLKALMPVAETLFKKNKRFPLDLSSVNPHDLARAMADMEIRERKSAPAAASRDQADEADEESFDAGPPVVRSPSASPTKPSPGGLQQKRGRQVTVTVEKMGFKDDKLQFVDAIITVFVVSGGKIMGVQHDTPPSSERKDKHLFWNTAITLMQNLDLILPGSAIFFEFRHFKKEKNKMSTKCWAFLEREDLKDGPHVLELYKKPTDLKRKSLSLMTTKQLYLHISVAISPPVN